MKKLNLTLGAALALGICAVALTRPDSPGLKFAPGVESKATQHFASAAKMAKTVSDKKNVKQRAAGDNFIDYGNIGSGTYGYIVTFNNSPQPLVDEQNGYEITYDSSYENHPEFIWYGATNYLSGGYEIGKRYTYTLTASAQNEDCTLTIIPTYMVVDNGSISDLGTVVNGTSFNITAGADPQTVSFTFDVSPFGRTDFPYPSLDIQMQCENGNAVLNITDIYLSESEGTYYGWNDRVFRDFKEFDSSNYASVTTNIEGAVVEGTQLTIPAAYSYSAESYIDIELPADFIIDPNYAYILNTAVTANQGVYVGVDLYSGVEEYDLTKVLGTSINFYNVAAGNSTDVPCYVSGLSSPVETVVMRYRLIPNGDFTEDLVISFDKIACQSDYVDLTGLPVATWDDENNSYKFEDNGVTYYGDLWTENEMDIKYIETSAESVDVPEMVAINGKAVTVAVLNTGKEDFYVKCPELRVINAPSVYYVDMNVNVGCKLERINTHALTTLYNNTLDNEEQYAPIIVYSEIPTATNIHTAVGGCVIPLVGTETADAPITSETSVRLWVKDENGSWIGLQANSTSGEWYSWQWYAYRIVSEGDEAYIPASFQLPAYSGEVVLSSVGNQNNYIKTLNSNITKLHIPVSMPVVYINWGSCTFRDIYLEGEYTGSVPASGNTIYSSDITVYAPTREAYDALKQNSSWQRALIMPYGWEFELLTIDVKRRGEFAQTYIEMTDADWDLGVNVKVTGSLSEVDLKNMKNMTSIQTLDLSEADFDAVPASWMENISSLIKVILPDFVTAIPDGAFRSCQSLSEINTENIQSFGRGCFNYCRALKGIDLSSAISISNDAFNNCYKLADFELPETLTYIGSSAFCNTAVKEVVIPEGITNLPGSVFSGCSQLASVKLPSTLKAISGYDFAETSISSIDIPEGVTTVGGRTFSSCTNLETVVIPSTLTELGYNAFTGCSKLNTVTCHAVVPPTASGDFLDGVDLNHCTLYVAPFAIDFYREAQYWNEFYIMKPLTDPVSSIVIDRPMEFNLLSEDNAVLANNPTMLLKYVDGSKVGQLTAEGDGTLSAGNFEMWSNLCSRDSYNSYYYSNNYYPATLINNAENMRADDVVISFYVEENTWQFFSVPFDVEMANVTANEGTDFVIRRYDSEARAAMGENATGNCWVNVEPTETLKAGQGYIIQAANNTKNESGYDNAAFIRFRSDNTLTKNNIFRSGNYTAALGEYPAEFAHNRSWNLVGNPYPCFYEVKTLLDNFYQPITIWRGSSYQAYSPLDDDILLRPFEAFFVQTPYEAPEMTFAAEGRMHYDDAVDFRTEDGNTANPSFRAPAANSDRVVFNFNVAGQNSDDRARVVFNPEAARSYEISRDAAKMFANESKGIEVFVSDALDYSICERPVEDGNVTVGVKAAVDGEYTFTLTSRNATGWKAILTDNVTGQVVDITDTPYVFNAEAGLDKDRFSICFVNVNSGVDSLIAEDAEVKVFNLQGMQVYKGLFREFKGDKGIYVVVCGDESFKIEL